jgi:DNA-directed RNA polymerase subunit E'/Rpb7
VAHLLEEIDGIKRRPAGQEVVAGCVAEVGGMRRRADIGRDAGLVDADDVVPSALEKVMRNRSAHDAAHADDDDLAFPEILPF